MKKIKAIIIFISICLFHTFINNEGVASTDIKIVGFNYANKIEQKTLTNSFPQNLSQSLITLTPGHLTLAGTNETIKIEFDYKANSYSVNYANFDLRSKIEGNFNTDDTSVALKPINLTVDHIYTGNTYTLAKTLDLMETDKNHLNYEIGLGYQNGVLLTKNALKVAFIDGTPKQQFTNNNIILYLGPKLKTKVAKNTYITGQYEYSRSIYNDGDLKAKIKGESISLGIQYNFFEEECDCEPENLKFKKSHLIEFNGSDSNLLISGILKTEEDNFTGSYDLTSALNLFSKEFEARFLYPVNQKQYLLLAMNSAKKRTKIKIETIPISGNYLDASATFILEEIGLKIGNRHYLIQQGPFKFYTGYGVKIVQSETKLHSFMGYTGKIENRVSGGSLLYGGLFTNIGFSKRISDDFYAFNEVGLEHYDGRPFGEPVFSLGSSFTVGLGLSF